MLVAPSALALQWWTAASVSGFRLAVVELLLVAAAVALVAEALVSMAAESVAEKLEVLVVVVVGFAR